MPWLVEWWCDIGDSTRTWVLRSPVLPDVIRQEIMSGSRVPQDATHQPWILERDCLVPMPGGRVVVHVFSLPRPPSAASRSSRFWRAADIICILPSGPP